MPCFKYKSYHGMSKTVQKSPLLISDCPYLVLVSCQARSRMTLDLSMPAGDRPLWHYSTIFFWFHRVSLFSRASRFMDTRELPLSLPFVISGTTTTWPHHRNIWNPLTEYGQSTHSYVIKSLKNIPTSRTSGEHATESTKRDS